MGNQLETLEKVHQNSFQKLSRHNKHFNNAFINYLDQSTLKELLKDLSIDSEKSNQLSNHFSSKLLLHSLEFNEDLSFQKLHSRLSTRLESSYKHLFNIKKFKVHEKKNLCSISRKIYVNQESYEFTLKDLINKKLAQKESFSEEQVLKILRKVVEAVLWINDNEFKNVILDSESITFVSEVNTKEAEMDNFMCKIIDQDIVQVSWYKYLLESLIEKKSSENSDSLPSPNHLNFYLSPQLLQEIQVQNFYPNVSLKSDIFALGMLMMEICCQQEMYFCYNMETVTLDYESLIHRIAKISYSNELKLLLAEMLQYDENNRIGFVSLKQKIDRIMVRPFDETRKLKRRSSSTMLKELLSCSRASHSVENSSKPTQKNDYSGKISTISLSARKKEDDPSPKNRKENQKRINNSLTKCNSLTKSNSLINLKCKTNSFLTSKKPGLLRVNSNKKLETENKNAIQKEIKLQTTAKVDYSKILKSRMKNQSKNLNCPVGDQFVKSPTAQIFIKGSDVFDRVNYIQKESIKAEVNQNNAIKNEISKILQPFQGLITDRSIQDDEMDRVYYRTINHSNFEQSNVQTLNENQKVNPIKKIQEFSRKSHTFVQKKNINLENINVLSSSSKKMIKSKSLIGNINQIKPTQSPLKKERILTEGNHQEVMLKKQQKLASAEKPQPKEGSISLKKVSQKRTLKVSFQKPVYQATQQIKNTNKNWIIGKLKAKNFIQTNSNEKSLLKEKNKSSSKKKESSLSKVKSVSLALNMNKKLTTFERQQVSQRQNDAIEVNADLAYSRNEIKQENNEEFIRTNTIIKRLQLTDEKIKLQQGQNFTQEKENINSNVKDQMIFVEKVLQKCALSSSRWQEGTQSIKDLTDSSSRHSNFIKYSDFKQKVNGSEKFQNHQRQNQFKKKSKIIDIDLGKMNNSKTESCRKAFYSQQPQISQNIKVKNEKATSKLKKLKELTIFTEDQQQRQTERIRKQDIDNEPNHDQNEDKQNNMKRSNLQNVKPQVKLTQIEQKLKKSITLLNVKNKSSSTLLSFDQIPYQRIEYANKVSNIVTSNLTTPSSLNELNRFYGKGMTVESTIQESGMHKKNNSTLSKPFQEIQLDYERESQPHISSPNLSKDVEIYHQEDRFKKPDIKESIKEQSDIFSMNNSEELTFRLKTQKNSQIQINQKSKQKYFQETFQSNFQKALYFERQDGSFVMREQNPMKKIQMQSIVGEKSQKINSETNNFQQFFTSSNFNQRHFQSQYEGYKESFLEENEQERLMKQYDMNSSCSSINLSEIEYKAQKGESLLLCQQQKYHGKNGSNSKQKKYKHISILQPQEDHKNRVHDLSINLRNAKNQNMQNKLIKLNQQSQQNTFRRYLKSDESNNHIIEFNENLFYEGEINQNGDFQGNGMIYKKDESKGKKKIIYTGSFVNGLYQGFGTLYQIGNVEAKKLRITNYDNRMTFGSQSNQLIKSITSQTSIPIKYEGQFCHGIENGFGTYFYSNGDKFSGCIKQGTVEGYGTYHIASKDQVFSGIWKSNVFMN